MVARQQEVVDRLRSADRSTRLTAVREIKNQIIGNKNKKLSYIRLEAVPRIVELLQQNDDNRLLIQSAAAVGSFAYDLEDGVKAVVTSGGVQQLLLAAHSQDEEVIKAALRALKLVWRSAGAQHLFQIDNVNLQRLISLTSYSNPQIADTAAQALAYFSGSAPKDTQAKLAENSCVIKALMNSALSDSPDKAVAAAALAALMAVSPSAVQACACHPRWHWGLLSLLKADPATSLQACICLQSICNMAQVISTSEQVVELCAGLRLQELQRAMLPVLLKLLHLPKVPDPVPSVLKGVLQHSLAMQKAANDMDAVSSLTTLMHHEQTWKSSPHFRAGVLHAVAVLCKNDGTARIKFMERASIGQVVKALEDTDLEVCLAACACIRSLSGSMRGLTNSDLAGLAPAVARLLSRPDERLQLTALEALANLVLDPATAQENVVQSEALARAVKLLSASSGELRCAAIWALANMTHEASPPVCKAVLAAVPWPLFAAVLSDADTNVQDKAFLFLRNLAAGEGAADSIKHWSNGAAVPALVARLHNLQGPVQPSQPILVHTLYCLSNFAATGCEEDRDAIAGVAAECIKAHLHHEGVEVRTAALWVILNLTDGADDDSLRGAVRRIQQFQSIGTEARLRDMLQDMSLDVRERVSTALNNFGCASEHSLAF